MSNKDDENHPSSIGSIFKGLDRFINIVADMIENDTNEVDINGTLNDLEKEKKIAGKYGVNIKLGGERFGGQRDIDKFKNNSSLDKIIPKVIEPITDVFEEEDKVIIVMEIPMVKEEDINLEINENILTINAVSNESRYYKNIKLKFNPIESNVKAKLNNSIYSIVINKESWLNEVCTCHKMKINVS